MYPIDRRKLAVHVYSMFRSLRKTATILQVSHMTISRWVNKSNTKRTNHIKVSKTQQVIETIKTSLKNDPFLSIRNLCDIIQDVLNIKVSRELVRTAIVKSGLTKKKARFFSEPKDLNIKIHYFVEQRQRFIDLGYDFYSLDETSFGRNVKHMLGYNEKGKQLRISRSQPRITTKSFMVIATKDKIVKKHGKNGSFRSQDFVDFIDSMHFKKPSVIMLDNVSFHHTKSILPICQVKGIHLLYTPPYCPRFNPIEGIFSIVKRKYYQGSSIENSFDSVTSKHCESFFRFSLSQKI